MHPVHVANHKKKMGKGLFFVMFILLSSAVVEETYDITATSVENLRDYYYNTF